MQYPDGQLVKIGDLVELGADNRWVVVFDIDGDEYSEEYPKEHWEYLKKGVMLKSRLYGCLIHMEEADEELKLLSRKK